MPFYIYGTKRGYMPDTNLHKIDSKGNVIKEWLPLIRLTDAADTPYGIESDYRSLWVLWGNAKTKVFIQQFDKKGNLIAQTDSGNTKNQGITTDRRALILSRAGPANPAVTKTALVISGPVPTNTLGPLTFDGRGVVGGKVGAAKLNLTTNKQAVLVEEVNASVSKSGVHSLGDRYYTTDPTSTVVYIHDKKGNLVKSFTPSYSTSTKIVDVVQDEDYFWMLGY
jgi:hypothetical protein